MLATTCGGGIFLWEWLWSPEKLWGWLLDHILLRERETFSFQFPVSLNPIFNSSVTSLIKNWTENHSEQFHLKNLWLVPMLTGRRSEQDWSELRSSNPTFDARDDGPLTHWRTPCVSLTPWLRKYISQFLYLEKCLNQIYFLSDDQSILTYLQYKV